jgi:Fe-S cluster assembly iron-binding protein IscA
VDRPTIEVTDRARTRLAEALTGGGEARYIRIRVGRG